MIEVAALGKACCFGPHTFNFAEAVELLLAADAAVVVRDGAELQAVIRRWLGDPEEARRRGAAARAVIAAQRGSTQRYVQRLHELLAARQRVTQLRA
jgi:3-deoxy-D-manno-octulosonic-acid transferase